jgi:hypothetical protein
MLVSSVVVTALLIISAVVAVVANVVAFYLWAAVIVMGLRIMGSINRSVPPGSAQGR